jgi:hypothetical protein
LEPPSTLFVPVLANLNFPTRLFGTTGVNRVPIGGADSAHESRTSNVPEHGIVRRKKASCRKKE